MNLTLPADQLCHYVSKQLTSIFPDKDIKDKEIASDVDSSLERLEYGLSRLNDKYAKIDNSIVFNHLHTDHYAMFLYLLANTIYKNNGNLLIANKIYALNKALHSLDVYFEVDLPDIFFFQHPVGTVLGRAKYSDYLVVYQRCTIGGKDRIYPVIGEGVVLYGGCSVIGNCTVGNNVWLSTGTCILQQDVPDNSVVFGCSPTLTIKQTKRKVLTDLFENNI